MLKYLVILLNDNSVSFCNYESFKGSRWMDQSVLYEGILFAMKENLNIQFVYPNESLPQGYEDIIESIDHVKIKPLLQSDGADIVVVDEWSVLAKTSIEVPVVMRTTWQGLFQNYTMLYKALEQTSRVNVVITDLEKFSDRMAPKYKKVLEDLAGKIERIYRDGDSPQLNLLSDRMMLKQMNNCGAGDEVITLAPDGSFYVCPAFYYADERVCVGNVEDGLNVPNPQLYKLDYAPICRQCDAWHCRRCVWLNKVTTREVNTPSHELCVVAHLERNASRQLLLNIRQHGQFLPEHEDIKEIDYLDPFEKAKQWKKN